MSGILFDRSALISGGIEWFSGKSLYTYDERDEYFIHFEYARYYVVVME